MKKLLGLLLIIGGIALGLYVGLWVMFVGGIFDIVTFVKNDWHPMTELGIGVVKIVCASITGVLCGFALILPGYTMLHD